MAELIATIILISSLFGIGVILIRKIPALLALEPLEIEKIPLITRLKIKAREVNPFKAFSFEEFLHKFLLRLRILFLKAENQTTHWAEKLKQRVKEKERLKETNNYWEELKKAKEGR